MRKTFVVMMLTVALCPAARGAEEARWSWQKPHAKVLPDGGLEWAPESFEYEKGESVRYIDYESGDDANPGTTKDRPWKHHPWDANAEGRAARCTGIHTYVFKRGAVYRGKLLANDRGRQSGQPGNPIRLTSDPTWGVGEAMLAGSVGIEGGWLRCGSEDAPPKMPEPGKVWFIDLDGSYIPRAIWERHGGETLRIPLARTPNWEDSHPIDPMYEWAQITSKIRTKKGDNQTLWEKEDGDESAGHYWLCDEENLTNPDPEFYVGARLWGEWWFNMATPHRAPNPVKNYNVKFHGIDAFPCGYPAGCKVGNRFYLEDLPQFLDEPGEYYYARDGEHAGRLYLRLPEERDPNRSVIEVPKGDYIVDIRHQHDVEVTGLRFSFINPPRGVFDRRPHPSMIWPRVSALPSAVRLVGSCSDVRVANCRFEHLVSAVTGFTRPSENNEIYFTTNEAKDDDNLFAPPLGDVMKDITISDCEILHTDDTAIGFRDGPVTGRAAPQDHVSELRSVNILRNRIHNVGMRQYGPRQSAVPTIGLTGIRQTEIAGNVLDRCGGAGIDIYGGKGAGDLRVLPLIRILIHHNKVTNTLLTCNDYGGIEVWQGGPAYVFNNVSGNALGRRNYSWFDGGASKTKGWNWINWGHAYYCDGQYRSFLFNNIAWGIQSRMTEEWRTTGAGDYEDTFLNMSAFCNVLGFQNHRFNNTAYKFAVGYHVAGRGHSRDSLMGNVLADIGGTYIRASSDLGGSFGEIKTTPKELSSLAYARNVYHGLTEDCWPDLVGSGQWTGGRTVTLDDFEEKMKALKMRCGEAGWMAEELPLRGPGNHDYRLKKGSVAEDRGVRFFVPWSLYATVGEWNFCRHPADPGLVIGENFYMTDEYLSRNMYGEVPWNNLTIHGAASESHQEGPLEDWTEGALVFDGRDTYCVLPDEELKSDYGRSYDINSDGKLVKESSVYPGERRRTVDIDTTNLLVEACFKTRPGSAGTVVASKLSGQAGYALDLDDAGRPRFTLRAAGTDCSRTATAAVNDGRWHHVIAEADRSAREGIAIYVDGSRADGRWTGRMPAQDASLSNTADFLVGKGPSGKPFAGAMDYLRVCRGTLEDAGTTIEELYAWQFDGPQLRDFAGRAPADGRRDAGAIETID